ncbi:SNF2 family N-terminal domain protein [Corynebacterium efficiens YS-314]|uniref:Putative chromodomain helicase n=1 Tax=Corynebacterium efficiens (strain DSM 44549 / YS-314 / AJ 12310 / JCM 11189 / NBRC 100395) TaxID=196164 RepID=Q8FQ70_COREF|nr:DEAD/DEAH box helicase [Corynebacterium efficiens]EEW50740.1 SNF2 family N-terminal domain protein [Corynebacterium efficiens YS-314]BAC18073.1 putative chromodomain helicase [Corynebacterium efficiens YS-314]
MTSHLLHGLWIKDRGLQLWIEQVEGHRIVLPEAVPAGTFPPVVDRILEGRTFRARMNVQLRTPKGRQVALPTPTAAFTPEEAVTVLAQLSFLQAELPAATRAQRETIAADLRWIITMHQGLTRFVQAGRVTLRTVMMDNAWWPQWQLAASLSERGWLAEMNNAAPGILLKNGGRDLAGTMANELPHWIANRILSDYRDEVLPYARHEFLDALLYNRPLRKGSTTLTHALNQWKNTISSAALQLVIIVEEPPAESDYEDPMDSIWPVRLMVRSGVDAPQPIQKHSLDTGGLESLRQQFETAKTISWLLDPARDDAIPAHEHNTVPTGDWDVFLNTAEIIDFIGHDVAKLKKAGITVMLPKAWSAYETRAKVEARTPGDPADSSTQSIIGLDQLVEYDWKISVGEVELTDDEMRELVESKTGLIRLRGDWVMADQDALRRITGYMDELSKSSRKRAKAEMEEAAMQAQLAEASGAEGWQLLAARAEELRQRFNEQFSGDGTGEVTLQELREIALKAAENEPVEFTGSQWYTSLLGGTETPAPRRVDIPETVTADLREYQRRGVDWLYWMSENNLGAVLADDMGLGKTLQLLSLLAVERAEHPDREPKPTLVVCPTSVVGNWAVEAAKFVPDLKVVVHHGPQRENGEAFLEKARRADLVVTSYGVVTRDFKLLGDVTFDRVVLDEAQAIKNSSTRISKAVRSLPSRHRVALTGTPVENRLAEMRSILDFCNPGVLGSASFFRNHFAKAIERDQDDEMTERLRQLTAPFILRRLKTDTAIIDDLPEKSEQIIRVDMTAEQASLYKALVDDVQQQLSQRQGMSRKGLVLATITRIKQICNHPAHFLNDGSPLTLRGRHRSGKVEALMDLLDDAVAQERRMLIFTQYTAFGQLLAPYLSDRLGVDIPFLHGGVSKLGRDRMVARFQAGDGPPAMILSLKAGGTGLNLTAASIVVHMDRWWNPAVENQATDRAFRIGQKNNVDVYKMITAGTMEESIQDILDGKMHLASAIVGEGEGWITELNPEELAALMSYREREGADV